MGTEPEWSRPLRGTDKPIQWIKAVVQLVIGIGTVIAVAILV